MSGLALLFIGGMAAAASAADCMNCAGPLMPARATACASTGHGGIGFCAQAPESHPDLPGNFTGPASHAAPQRLAGRWLAQQKVIGAGFAMDTEFLWEHHYAVYRQLTQRARRGEVAAEPGAILRTGRASCLNGAASCHAGPVLRP